MEREYPGVIRVNILLKENYFPNYFILKKFNGLFSYIIFTHTQILMNDSIENYIKYRFHPVYFK